MQAITIDGSMGEGGGAVLRTALALSAVSMKPIRIYNIRAKRPNPGLAPQHMHGVKALANLTGAKVEGLWLGSTELRFEPGAVKGGRYRIDIGTAGSITLILQALMPAAAFADSSVEVEITGGTDVPMSPPVDYLINVTLPMLRKMGYDGEVTRVRRGHYPRGGGIVRAIIRPVQKLGAIHLLELGGVLRIEGISHCVRLPERIATRMAHAAKLVLLKAGYADVDIKIEAYDPTGDLHLGPGAGITLWAEGESGSIVGASALGRPGKPAEEVAREAAEALLQQLRTGCGVDRYLTDQLIPYMALADGTSEITSAELTSHALTNIALVERVLNVKFEVNGQMGQPGRIRVKGLGFTRAQRF
ncbi:MAG: RNA 3'-terminal phosphate cyclase [Hadesarchaea archaeon]|nr:RNA 3'-terminal phosphate cyclase [Hadesarchaea archaeon]